MGEQGWLRLLVTGLATTHVAGLIAGHVLPWTGSLTMVAFLLYTLSVTGTRQVLVARRIGIACLAALALDVDARTGGRCFPNVLIDLTAGGVREFEGTLLVVGLAALAVSACLPWRRGVHRAALAAVAFLVLLAAPMLYAWAQPRTEVEVGTRISAEARQRLLDRARAESQERGTVVAIAIMDDPLPARLPEQTEAPDWSLGLSPAAPAAALFAVLAFIAGGRGTEDPV
ncbi:hypothetical protein ACPPVO_17155 [Dactylosporangium sp. McL0621]|uniref:hypothetical protein n=1 Tax=Dactylosporangium sp. McL0621 TaxID=3415678 RepID=UPI003CF7F0F2